MATSEAGMIRADLRLPDVPGLDDAGLAHWFPGFDGQWTEQTKTLLRAHGATGLDLNANWAGVPADWHCTCCRRPKPMIVRKARNGVLLAHLDLHHDHLRDHLQSLVGANRGCLLEAHLRYSGNMCPRVGHSWSASQLPNWPAHSGMIG